eukprot:m.259868 g.259868  ORF g.259868 m.259868 type:complete len:338 (+) comp16210_c0_seq2:82-1095(+)
MSDEDYIKVQRLTDINDSKADSHIVELPLEDDGFLLLKTLQNNFQEAVGLQVYNENAGCMRALRLVEDIKIRPPKEGWGNVVYQVVETQKKDIKEVNNSVDDTEEVRKRRRSRSRSRERSRDRDCEDESKDTDRRERSADVSRGSRSQGRACYNCGKTDHLANDCPDPNRRSKPKQSCHTCGGEGHIAAMCPSQQGARFNQSADQCRLCGGKGHFKRNCPNQLPKNVCFKCGMSGHPGRNCPNSNMPTGPPIDFRACFRCFQVGHKASNCPLLFQGVSQNSCYKCGLEGHLARNCDRCVICKAQGHRQYQCPFKANGGPPSGAPSFQAPGPFQPPGL